MCTQYATACYNGIVYVIRHSLVINSWGCVSGFHSLLGHHKWIISRRCDHQNTIPSVLKCLICTFPEKQHTKLKILQHVYKKIWKQKLQQNYMGCLPASAKFFVFSQTWLKSIYQGGFSVVLDVRLKTIPLALLLKGLFQR